MSQYDHPEDWTPSVRAAKVVLALKAGREYTVEELSGYCGLTERGARYLLERLSRVFPITCDDKAAPEVWYWMGPEGHF